MSANGSEAQQGTARIIVYMLAVTEPEIEPLLEAIADLLVEHGQAIEGDGTKAILAAEAWEAPESEAGLIAQVGEHASVVLIPGEPPED